MVDRLKVAKHGVLGGRLVEVPQLQKQEVIRRDKDDVKERRCKK